MSRTLFWYIFRDLLRIFLLATVGLAGIMSFGGLLRPLTERGLDAAQVGRVLMYFIPAMMTYSLPIAAVFATTMVYGRLSADNELIACRAAGIDHFSISLPALVLGLVVAIISLLFLCFVVPVFNLKVERVVYANLAELVARNIERTHEIPFDDLTIFASDAKVAPQSDSDQQVVVLSGPLITTNVAYDRAKVPKGERTPRIPDRFYMARQATVFIDRSRDTDQITIDAVLEDGMGFSRELAGSAQGGVQTARFGPYPVESPIKENTKFKNIFELKELYLQPAKSRRINRSRLDLVHYDQELAFLALLAKRLNENGELLLAAAARPTESLRLAGLWQSVDHHGEEITLRGVPGDDRRTIRFEQAEVGGRTVADAAEVRLRAQPDAAGRIIFTVRLFDPVIRTGEQVLPENTLTRRIVVPMPAPVAALADQSADYYATAPSIPQDQRRVLQKDLLRLRCAIQSEMHGRASFAISCLILVMVGSTLGMMFRSGNFLSAFAVSAVPAIIIITLIIAGQQVSDNVAVRDSLRLGLSLIWSGNAVVAALAIALMWRMQKQ